MCIRDSDGNNKIELKTSLKDSLASAANYILCSIPPGANGDPSLLVYRSEIASARNLCWIGYLSTTGVYGNRNGAEVDEYSAVQPTRERGRRRVAAEASWLEFGKVTGHNAHVFRLAGIYGPNRNVIIRVRAGSANRIHKKRHVFSRIHVDDVVNVNLWFLAHNTREEKSGIFNVGTGHAATFNELADAVIEWHGTGTKRYIPFPEHIENAYQSFTQADITRLRQAGYSAPMTTLEAGLEAYYHYHSSAVQVPA